MGDNIIFPKLRAAILRANPWLDPWHEKVVSAPMPYSRAYNKKFAIAWVNTFESGSWLKICPELCKKPGTGYSWPGSVSDRTVRGVYLHEVGHVVHGQLKNEWAVLNALRRLGGPRVTSYEPNGEEAFAETFRLFAGNPALLREGRPWRYEFLLRHGINPIADMPRSWERGLVGKAPQRFYDQCERWILRGKKSVAV